MKLGRGTISCLAALGIACLLGTALAYSQARPTSQAGGQKPMLSEEAFKNVQVLRGIPVKEFMATMGFFSASLSGGATFIYTLFSGLTSLGL